MAKSSVLDEAIAENPGVGRKVDHIVAALADHLSPEEMDRLLDMLAAPVSEWGHTQMVGIIRHLCDHYGVEHDRLGEKSVRGWRAER